MSDFIVPDMSCGHCTRAITRAITALDPAATVACDLQAKTVHVDSTADTAALRGAIEAEGYAVQAA